MLLFYWEMTRASSNKLAIEKMCLRLFIAVILSISGVRISYYFRSEADKFFPIQSKSLQWSFSFWFLPKDALDKKLVNSNLVLVSCASVQNVEKY